MKELVFFGKINSEDEVAIKLDEVTMSCKDSESLISLRDFIDKCINDIELNSSFDHEHYSLQDSDDYKGSDFIVYNNASEE